MEVAVNLHLRYPLILGTNWPAFSHLLGYLCADVSWKTGRGGEHISSSIPCRLSYRACLLHPESETYGAVITTLYELQVLAFLPPLVFIPVGNCIDMYLLICILRFAKKVPTGTFSL